jgi:hypothetical protein
VGLTLAPAPDASAGKAACAGNGVPVSAGAPAQNGGAAGPAAAAGAGAPLKWSERGADLLDDQVNFSYQIFNLRLLLERAISDRWTDDGRPRVQAVIALPISIDPPAFAVGSAATVEARLSVGPVGGPPIVNRRPSLVALFPQEETYNTWSVNRHGLQVSGSAASGGLGASGGATRNTSASSIRRQADIVAVEREAGPGVLIVAWQFRPSPGERSVKAGLRQVLASWH